MLTEREQVELTRRFLARVETVRTRTGSLSRQAWADLGSWNRADIVRFERATAKLWPAASRAAVNSSAGYYRLLSGAPVDVGGVAVAPAATAPFHALWASLKDGSAWVDAMSLASARAEALGADLVIEATREVAARSTSRGVQGWRRVIGTGSCRWCADVARQRYYSAESATFGHDHCNCIVAPIYGDADPGRVINAEHVSTVASTLPVRI